MLERNTPLRALPGIGETRAAAFARQGVSTAGELLYFFPRAYENRGDVIPVSEAADGAVCALLLTISGKPATRTGGRGVLYTRVVASDESGSVDLVFFGQEFLVRALAPGRRFRVYGPVKYSLYGKEMVSPKMEAADTGAPLLPVVPVYPLSAGLTQTVVTRAVEAVLPLCEGLEDWPEELRAEYGLLPRAERSFCVCAGQRTPGG